MQARSIINERPDEALAICNDILNDHIDDDIAQKALFMSGYIMMDAERFGLAYNIYQRCAQLNPKLSSVWSNMGMCLEEYSPAKAKKCFKKAYSLDNRNADALANEGLMCLQSGQPERCIELSQKALIIKPELKAGQTTTTPLALSTERAGITVSRTGTAKLALLLSTANRVSVTRLCSQLVFMN